MRPIRPTRFDAARAAARARTRAFVRDCRGAAMAEYALLIAVVALVALVGARRLGASVRNGASLFAAYISAA